MRGVPKIRLIEAVQQPGGGLPPVSLTPIVSRTLQAGETAFFQNQYRLFGSIITGNSNPKDQPGIIYGSAPEIPLLAATLGLNDPTAFGTLLFLCTQLFLSGGGEMPPPLLQRIGQAVAHPPAGELPWVIALLPRGAELVLNDSHPYGMTHLTREREYLYLPDLNAEEVVLIPNADPEVATPPPVTVTYLSGKLWDGQELGRPFISTAVTLHESSHYARWMDLQRWIDSNVARTEGERDPAFKKHSLRGEDGRYRIDSGFASLFLELSACEAVGLFFQMMLTMASIPHSPLVSLCDPFGMELLQSRAFTLSLLTNACSSSYLPSGGIEPDSILPLQKVPSRKDREGSLKLLLLAGRIGHQFTTTALGNLPS